MSSMCNVSEESLDDNQIPSILLHIDTEMKNNFHLICNHDASSC